MWKWFVAYVLFGTWLSCIKLKFETEGFVAGDVILRYNDTETVTADELIDAQQKAKQEVNQVEIQYVHFNEDGSYQVITKTIPSSGTGAWFCSI